MVMDQVLTLEEHRTPHTVKEHEVKVWLLRLRGKLKRYYINHTLATTIF